VTKRRRRLTEIGSHKTRCVFDRYNIAADENLKDAILKLRGCGQ
jgi:hypothetical protein